MICSRGWFARLSAAALLLVFTVPVFASFNTARQADYRWTASPSSSEIHATLTVDRYNVERDEDGARVTFKQALPDDSPLPRVATWIAVPNGSGLTASVSHQPTFTATGVLAPDKAGFEPTVEVGDPFVFRGIRLFPVWVTPARVDARGEVDVANTLEVTFRREGRDNRIVGKTGSIPVSGEVKQFLAAHVLNLDEIDLQEVAPLGRILIVTSNNAQILNQLNPYIHWKRQQGYRVSLATPSSTTNYVEIRTLIQNAYTADDPIPLDYVLMVGDADGTVSMAAYNNLTDHWYTELEGSDILGDVAIGRFSVRDINTELRRAVNKTLTYERDVSLADTTWLTKVCLTAGSNSGISTIQTNRAIKAMFTDRGISADTLWYTMPGGNWGIPQFIVDQINAGVHFVNYRGYYGMSGWNDSYLTQFTNGNRLPVVITITCGTGTWATETQSISEGFFRAGTSNSLRGAVASVGTATTGTHTRFNNVVDAGLYEGIVLDHIRSLGWSLLNGKYRLWEAFHSTGDAGQVENFTYWNNLMGDPALRVWVGVPHVPTVTHTGLSDGQNYVDVDVTLPGEWPDMIWATLANDEDVLDSRRLDTGGHVRLALNPADLTGDIVLTVAGDNVVPYQDTLSTAAQSPYLVAGDVTVDDGAEGDGIANPGETLTLDVDVVNTGAVSSTGQIVTITSDDPWVTITGGGDFFVPSVNAGGSYLVTDAVTLTLADWTPDGAVPEITMTAGDDQTSAVRLPVQAFTASSEGLEPVVDQMGDGTLMPGETVAVRLPLTNAGSIAGDNISVTASTDAPEVTIDTGEHFYGTVDVGDTLANDDSPFSVTASGDAVTGEVVDLTARVVTESGMVDTVTYRMYVADPRTRGATGPDKHGYWAIDNTDTDLDQAPIYSWRDISLPGNDIGITDNGSEEDQSVVVDLPFIFSYYDSTYDQITVNSNGWAAFGDQSTFVLFRNWPIPNPLGPQAMIAPNWDDLEIGTDGGVYTYNDVTTGRFIIQWNMVTAYTNTPQVFQAVLLNPAIWPTSTGNGQIMFQYQQFSEELSSSSDNDYCTVGIESPDKLDGIQYLYWADYGSNAAEIVADRAILFTDDLGNPAGGAPSAVITPGDGFDLTVVGEHTWRDSITISNTGDGPLIWGMEAVDGMVTQAQLRNHLGLTPVVLKRSVAPGVHSRGAVGDTRSTLSTGTASEPKGWRGLPGLAGSGGDAGIMRSGGPDGFGYYWYDSNEEDGPEYNWIDETGTSFTTADIVANDYDDGYFSPIDLPFSFPFYGLDYNQVWVNTNGFLTFAADQPGDSTYTNRSMPSNRAPRNGYPATTVAPFWDDLNPEEGGTVSWWTGVEDSLLVTFNEINGWGPRGGPYTFQVLLTRDGVIKFQYQDMGTERLDESTIGIQNEDGTQGLTINHNSLYMEDGLAIRILVPTVWLRTLDSSGFVAVDSTGYGRFEVTGESLPLGDYSGSLRIQTNDPDHQEELLPVDFHIDAGGQPPVVGDIPDQTVNQGEAFDVVSLDEYVDDPLWSDNRITWSASGAVALEVTIQNRRLAVQPIDPNWYGSETLTLTATNPEGLNDSDEVTFTVVDVDAPPTAFSLASPVDGDTVSSRTVPFAWFTAVDPEAGPVTYTLFVASQGDTAQVEELSDTTATVDLADAGLTVTSYQEYAWWVKAFDEAGNPRTSREVFYFRMFDLDVPESEALPTDFAVSALYPNPFNPVTSFEVALPIASPLTYDVFDVLGRQVGHLAVGMQRAGRHRFQWSGTDAPSGIYFIVVQAGSHRQIRKAVLMK